MRKPRGNLSTGLVMSLVAAGTTWVAMMSWGGFTDNDAAYLGPLMVLAVTVAVTGALARWWRLPAVLVILAQLAASAIVFSLVLTGSPLPVAGAWTELIDGFRGAVDSAQEYASPVPMQVPGVHPLLISGGLASMLILDLLACTFRRVPLAGLPLLTIYSVPISLLGGGVSLWVFVPTAIGFMAMLFLHENDMINRWGRPIGSDRDGAGTIGSFGVRTGAAKSNATAIGSVATGLAVVVPFLIPTLDINVFDFGAGNGDDGNVKIQNPTADLLRDLNRGKDIPLIRITTDDPDPDYLRVTALNRYSDSEWSPGNRDIPSENRPDGLMPALQGVSADVGREEYNYHVTINDDFESAWLPTQFPLAAIEAEGDWRYDDRTMDFFRWDEDIDTRGMDYTMRSIDLDLEGSELATASLSTSVVSTEFRELPDDLPDIVEDLAFSVTSDAATRFDKAVALQNWFRSEFRYSLEKGPGGSSVDDLEAFLTPGDGGRIGYCEQFAASMAVMARVIGIPARMAVGFLEPALVPGTTNTYEYSSHDLHAWPELYFDGFGWVMFEPTPGNRAESVPSYTLGRGGEVVDPTVPTGPAESDDITRVPETDKPSEAPQADDTTGSNDGDAAFPWVRVGGGLGGGALLVLLAMTPRLLRRRARERRLVGGPEAAWDELRATAIDLRLFWPGSRSPRETRDRLVELFGAPGDEFASDRPARGPAVNPDAVVAIDRIVRDLELLRYSRSHTAEAGHLRAEVETCIEALTAGVSPRVRRRAEWLPASVLSSKARSRARAEDQPVRTQWGGVVEHMG
jgi:transglutaminase-like putative cysteine protease